MFLIKIKYSIHCLIIGINSWLLSFFLYSPRFILFLGKDSGTTRRDNLLLQCIDPFTRELIGIERHQLYTRILQPSIANFFGLCGERRDLLALLGTPGIAYLALILTLSFLYCALRKYFSKGLSIAATFCISTSMVTQWTNTHWGHPDSLTFLPISILLFKRNYFIIVLCTFLGSLNDERFILSIPFLILWWYLTSQKDVEKLKLYRTIFSFAAGLLILIFFKLALINGYVGPGIEKEESLFINLLNDYFFPIVLNPIKWPQFIFLIFLGFRWLWILPVAALIICIRNRKIFIFTSLFIPILFSSLVIAINADIGRSISFCYPLIPVSMIIIKDIGKWSNKKLIYFLNLILMFNIFTPGAKVFYVPPDWWKTNPLEWSSPALPLPLNLWRWFTSPNGAGSWNE